MTEQEAKHDRHSRPSFEVLGTRPEYILRAEHLIDGPRPEVWDVFFSSRDYLRTQDAHDVRFIDPEFDKREGGSFRFGMLYLGREISFRGTYLSIKEPEQIVSSSIWESADDEFEDETKVTCTFHEEAGKTRFVLEQGPIKSMPRLDLHKEYWAYILHMLAKYFKAPKKVTPVQTP